VDPVVRSRDLPRAADRPEDHGQALARPDHDVRLHPAAHHQILLLIISEATQQALLGDDFSITNALLVIITLVVLDRGLDWLQHRSPLVSRATQSLPVVLVADGDPLQEVLDREKIDVADVLQEARSSQGIDQLDQIRYAVLERSGTISIVPK
jgi:uncharacterized membrane protein YcaP (DUF421 family)